ncbi:MAG: cation diffusion facilitator family transporter [Saccharospirillum sp.]
MSKAHTTERLSREQRQRLVDRTNWLALVVDSVAFVVKLVVGLSVRSPALIADAMHSLSDLLADIPIIVLAKVSHQAADQNHPYGHARFETLGTVMVGGVLLAVALGIGYESVHLLFGDQRPEPSWLAVVTVIIAIGLKEGFFQYAIRQARKAQSSLLEANAWHARSDSLSSVVVLIGVGATLLGFPQVEILAALLVAALIAKMGYQLAWEAIQELVDRGVSPEQEAGITQTLASVPGVRDVHMVRSRLMGNDIFVDAHIRVGGLLSVSEGHQINEWALKALKEAHPEVEDVTLHIDHEADPQDDPQRPLAPLRPAIEAILKERGIVGYERLVIHYRRQHAELELRWLETTDDADLESRCRQLVQEVPWIQTIVLTEHLKTITGSD